MKLLLEIKNIENSDVITTSAPLFNSFQRISSNRWMFYNADLSSIDSRDLEKHIYSVYGTPNVAGVDESLFATYSKIVEDENFVADLRVYHYVNGKWVECSTHCGPEYNHKSNQQLG